MSFDAKPSGDSGQVKRSLKKQTTSSNVPFATSINQVVTAPILSPAHASKPVNQSFIAHHFSLTKSVRLVHPAPILSDIHVNFPVKKFTTAVYASLIADTILL